jgi:hypothetical protein
MQSLASRAKQSKANQVMPVSIQSEPKPSDQSQVHGSGSSSSSDGLDNEAKKAGSGDKAGSASRKTERTHSVEELSPSPEPLQELEEFDSDDDL